MKNKDNSKSQINLNESFVTPRGEENKSSDENKNKRKNKSK